MGPKTEMAASEGLSSWGFGAAETVTISMVKRRLLSVNCMMST